MSILSNFPTEKITLVKQNSDRFEDIEAMVQKGQIMTEDVKIPVEEGDHIIRKLPNGLTEKYRIIDRGYQDAFGGLPAIYDMEVEKITDADNDTKAHSTIYNLHGDNTRVNINSNDSSINIIDKSSEELFADLRSTVNQNISSPEKEELLKRVDELEKAKGTDSFSKKYAEFMAIAANHTTVLAPYFPALIQFLTQ